MRSRAATKQADRLPSPDTEGEGGLTGTSQKRSGVSVARSHQQRYRLRRGASALQPR